MFCRIIKKQINRFLDEQVPLSAGVRKHLEHCPSCRLYYENLLRVETKLRREMPEQPDVDMSALEQRILSRIRGEPETVLVRPQIHQRLRALTRIAAVVLISAALFGLFRSFKSPSARPNVPAEINPLGRAIASDFYAVQNRLLADSLQQPFETEMDNLARDMQTAVRFVAACLPQPPWGLELP
ncbi:MAG: hypothetical protein WHS88_05570 [Anaerohalosphaeraceae bacterium]